MDDKYLEKESFKHLDLTPNKQGCAPERHPTKKKKKQKAGKTRQSLDARQDAIDQRKLRF